jgi:hypothetical protein
MMAKRDKHGTQELRYHVLPAVLFLVVLLICGTGRGIAGAQNDGDQTNYVTVTVGEPFMVLVEEHYGYESKVVIAKDGNTVATKVVKPTTEGPDRVLLETDDWPEGEYNCITYYLVYIDFQQISFSDFWSHWRYEDQEDCVHRFFLMGTSDETVEFTKSMWDANWRVIDVYVDLYQPLYDLEVEVLDSNSPDADNWTYDLDMEESKGYRGYGWFAEGPDTYWVFKRILNVSSLKPICRGAGWRLTGSISINVVPEDLTSMKYEQKNNALYLTGESDSLLWKWNVGDDIDEVPVSASTSYLTTQDRGSYYTISLKVATALFDNLEKAVLEASDRERAAGYKVDVNKCSGLIAQSEASFAAGSYKDAFDSLLTARSLALDIDGDGVPNENDFAPYFNNIIIYVGSSLLAIGATVGGWFGVSRDRRRRRRIKKKIERQKAEIIDMIEEETETKSRDAGTR